MTSCWKIKQLCAAASVAASHAGSSLLLTRSPCFQAFGLVDSGARQVALKAFGRVIKTLPEGDLHFSPLLVCRRQYEGSESRADCCRRCRLCFDSLFVILLSSLCRFIAPLPLPTVNVRGDGSVAVREAVEREKLNPEPVVA